MAMNERAIFEAALDLENAGTREAFLAEACGGDAQLRAKVDSLLKSHDTAGSFLDVPAVEQMGHDTANTIVGILNAEGDDAVDLSFLQPSAKAGSMGILGHYEKSLNCLAGERLESYSRLSTRSCTAV
jgi:hypothetical protein